MDTRKIAAEYRLTQWSQAMRDKAASGESIEEFCHNRGISRNTYFYWQRKVRESACQKLEMVDATERAPNGWAVCETAPMAREGSSIHMEIGKCRVSVGSNVAAEALEKVLRVLMKLC